MSVEASAPASANSAPRTVPESASPPKTEAAMTTISGTAAWRSAWIA